MEQPPILGRPTPQRATGPSPGPDGSRTDEERRTLRTTLLITAGVSVVVLTVCNGLLLLLYRHSSLGVVVTLGTFLAGGALTALRRRSRQLTAVVLCVQGLLAVAAVVGALVALRAGFATGVLAGTVTLAGLAVLSLIALLYVTGEPTAASRRLTWATVVGVVAAMLCGYALLLWGGASPTHRRTYVAPPERSVDFLIEDGQDFRQDATSFERYTCPDGRPELTALFGTLVEPGRQRLATPDDVTTLEQNTAGATSTAIVTASIAVVDEVDGTTGPPQTWTFHLEKGATDSYWRVCRIERPD